jgi:hypothetical protein
MFSSHLELSRGQHACEHANEKFVGHGARNATEIGIGKVNNDQTRFSSKPVSYWVGPQGYKVIALGDICFAQDGDLC